MGIARKRFRLGTAGIGFAVASTLIFGQADAAHAPTVTSPIPTPALAVAASALSAGPASASVRSKYSAEPFRKLQVMTPQTSLRLKPALEERSYATLAIGLIRFPDGAVTLPGRLNPVKRQTEQPDATEVGHGISVPSRIIMAEAFNAYPSEEGSGAHTSPSFAGLPLVSSAHAAAPGGAGIEAMGGPLSRLPIEGHVLFDGDDDALGSAAQTRLDKVIKVLRASHASLDVVAYAGEPESRASDARRLSLRRGLAVRSYLVARGIDQKRISVRPMGGVRDDGPQQRVDVYYASY